MKDKPTLGNLLDLARKEWTAQLAQIQQYRTLLSLIARHPDKVDALKPEIERLLNGGA